MTTDKYQTQTMEIIKGGLLLRVVQQREPYKTVIVSMYTIEDEETGETLQDRRFLGSVSLSKKEAEILKLVIRGDD